MKLLSMKLDGQDRAGILIGDEVLDATAYFEILESKGEWIDAVGDRTSFQHIEGAYRDALDLCGSHGCEWLTNIVSKFDSTPTLANELRSTETLRPLTSIKLNPPVVAPGKILAVGLNYAAHAAEQNIEPPEFPLIFSKCVTALAASDDEIRLPRISKMIDYEAELAVVIAKKARSVSAADALDYVAGYTIMNDVTARDLQKRERQWVRAKGLDTFAPCGPWLVTKEEIKNPHALDIKLTVNGELRQSSNTGDLIFKIPQLIEFISQDLTLMPGDIITTGTPSGVGVFMKPPVFLKHGDEIVITIGSIGSLKNRVIAS